MTDKNLVSDFELQRAPTVSLRSSWRPTIASLVRAPATWLVLVVGLSTLVRVVIALGVRSPWILPDEIVYSEIAKSIAGGNRPEVRGVPVFGWGEVYPTLVAPAWALIGDAVHAYRATLLINALVMSSAAVPAYFLARLFVSQRAAVLVAAMTVLVPSMAYAGTVMTENAFYPVFLLAVLLIARAVQHPTVGRQAMAMAGLVLVAFTRIQGLALVGAYLAAALIYGLTGSSSGRASYLRRFVPTGVLLLVAALAPTAASVVLRDGPFGWLGARSNTFAGFHAPEVPEWFLYLVADLILYVAVVPVAATTVMIGRGLSPRATAHVRLFAAVALPTLAAMFTSVSLVSAALDVDGTENLNERYVFYVVPLFFIGLAVWLQGDAPARGRWAWAVVAACCVAVAVLPIDRLHYNAGFQSPALIPWITLSLPRPMLVAAAVAFVLACGAFWVTCRRARAGRLWLLVGVWMGIVGVLAMGSNSISSGEAAARAFGGQAADWIDKAVPTGTTVAVVWDQRFAPVDHPAPVYFRILVLEEFNRRLGTVYRIGRPTYYETFLPTVPAAVRTDGTLLGAGGRPLLARYVLAPCRTPVVGRVVGIGAHGSVRLIKVPGTIRLTASRQGC